jgi:phosphoribosylformimino-5-aminoimidazole carboxamide ribotide isomerase
MSCIEIIPVIDLKGGKAVAAVGAQGRAAYKPLDTPLCRTGDAVDAALGYMSIYPFPRLYIADLDAIENGRFHDSVLERIKDALPHTELWIDNGLNEETACRAWLSRGLGRLALGSESQRETDLAPRLDAILSLDFRGNRFLGPGALLDCPQAWPREVIGMALDDVGAGRGPNLERLARLLRLAPDRALYAAGGVRGVSDLTTLAGMGVRGALVATALHNGALSARDVRSLYATG